MKKFLSIVVFAFIIALGGQTMQAQSLSQNNNRPEAKAKVELVELSKALGLNTMQERTLFRALVQKEVKYNRYVNNPEASQEDAKAHKIKYDTAFDEAMKETLTDAQYSKWKTMRKGK